MRLFRLVLALLLASGGTATRAEVEVSFWSRELGLDLPSDG